MRNVRDKNRFKLSRICTYQTAKKNMCHTCKSCLNLQDFSSNDSCSSKITTMSKILPVKLFVNKITRKVTKISKIEMFFTFSSSLEKLSPFST